jgi:membrane fusion protein, multidrug efflux system
MKRTAPLALALALALAACSRGGDGGGGPAGGPGPAAGAARPVPVRAALAEARNVPIEVRGVGRIVSAQSVAIRAQVTGPILRTAFTEGQAVKAGDLLLEIDPRPYESALAEARARLAQDRARAENARADVKRLAELVEKEYVTRQQYDAARATAAALDAAVQGDEAAVQQASLNLANCRIRSPVAGRTGRLLVQPGNLVTAQAQTPLLTVEQVKPVFASFALPERHLAALRGWRERPPPVRVLAGGGPPIEGTLDFVDNAVDPSTGTILLKARIPNADEALWPGQVVDVYLRLAERANAVVVPASAVAQGQQGDYAYVVGPDRKAQLRQVVVEQAGDQETVISKGITAGELVVTEGQLKLQPGAVVEVVQEKAPGT